MALRECLLLLETAEDIFPFILQLLGQLGFKCHFRQILIDLGSLEGICQRILTLHFLLVEYGSMACSGRVPAGSPHLDGIVLPRECVMIS